MKPISMSTAKAMPPLLPASIIDCIIAPASMNWRKLWTGGKPGSSIPAPAPPVWTASSRVGKTTIGAISCGRRKVWRIERAPSARTTRALVARSLTPATGSSSSPALSSFSRWWPVLSTKTSSRVGRTSSSDSTAIPASSRARTTRGMSAAPFSTSSRTRLPSFGGSSSNRRPGHVLYWLRRLASAYLSARASGHAPASAARRATALVAALLLGRER